MRKLGSVRLGRTAGSLRIIIPNSKRPNIKKKYGEMYKIGHTNERVHQNVQNLNWHVKNRMYRFAKNKCVFVRCGLFFELSFLLALCRSIQCYDTLSKNKKK